MAQSWKKLDDIMRQFSPRLSCFITLRTSRRRDGRTTRSPSWSWISGTSSQEWLRMRRFKRSTMWC